MAGFRAWRLLPLLVLLLVACGNAPGGEAGAGSDLVLVPGQGVGPIRLSMSHDEVRGAWGEPEVVVGDGTIWEYPLRCAALTFDGEGRVQMATIGHATEAERAFAGPCVGASVEGGLALGAPFETARALFPEAEEQRIDRAGRLSLALRERATTLQFSGDGRLQFAATSRPRPRE